MNAISHRKVAINGIELFLPEPRRRQSDAPAPATRPTQPSNPATRNLRNHFKTITTGNLSSNHHTAGFRFPVFEPKCA
jgi:hypothetical protein